MPERNKYLWYTDTHLWPWNRFKMLNSILDEKPKAVFLTGDISNCSQLLEGDLEFLGKRIGRPLLFVLGNHCCWLSSFEETHNKVRNLCKKYKNLIWMSDCDDAYQLTDEVGVISVDGWYDAMVGNPEFIKFTFDWFMISNFRKMASWKERFKKFRQLAEDSAKSAVNKLEKAIEEYKTVYLLTHMPPWPEANRCHSLMSDVFYSPYNTNFALGKALEKVMEKHKKRNLIVAAGHTHSAVQIQVSRNIQCMVGRGAYHKITDEEILYI